MRWGLEIEYMIVDRAGPEPGRVRDFTNLTFDEIARMLAVKPGLDDPSLATGDLGIRSGYWYLEGDERSNPDGSFSTMAVKGIEIRTPPCPSVESAIDQLIWIEERLATVLGRHGLGLAIAGFNPVCPSYALDPPLNAFELEQRRVDRSFDGAHVYTLSYGPDINLSVSGWSAEQALDAARKLNRYSPFVVPFSFSSPFAAGEVWPGLSKRTYERAAYRPAVKLFFGSERIRQHAASSRLVHPARLPSEDGRIEYKPFDAILSVELLSACCHLLEGICLADDLHERCESTDLALYRRAAMHGFEDAEIRQGATEVLLKAEAALIGARLTGAARSLRPLNELLLARRTPAHAMLAAYRQTGLMYKPGGLAAAGLDSPSGSRSTSEKKSHASESVI